MGQPEKTSDRAIRVGEIMLYIMILYGCTIVIALLT